jgi:hypothetical protein
MLTTVAYLGISFASASRALQRFLTSKLCRAEHSGAKEQSIGCNTNHTPSQLPRHTSTSGGGYVQALDPHCPLLV